MKKYYAGIGSRETPTDILAKMAALAKVAAHFGWVLRSGGADGADTMFERGCDAVNGDKEIFLPWKGFNHNTSMLHTPTEHAMRRAELVHPAWKHLRQPAKLLVARNMHQIAGQDMITYVNFVICYTSDGCESEATYTSNTGGTGSAIKLASQAEIPICNLKNDNAFERALDLISQD